MKTKKIIIIDGMTGAGKTTFLKVLIANEIEFEPICVYTDRAPRAWESTENKYDNIQFLNKAEFDNFPFDFVLNEGFGTRYGIKLEEVADLIERNDLVLFSSNPKTVKVVREAFPEVKYFSIYIESNEPERKQRILAEATNKKEQEKRMTKLLRQMKREKHTFDYIIYNNGSIEEFESEVMKVLAEILK